MSHAETLLSMAVAACRYSRPSHCSRSSVGRKPNVTGMPIPSSMPHQALLLQNPGLDPTSKSKRVQELARGQPRRHARAGGTARDRLVTQLRLQCSPRAGTIGGHRSQNEHWKEPRMHHSERVIIIGGGFSGVALAAELVRRGAASSITLVESGDRVGRGLAYGTASASHLLNTRADQMSLYGDDPEHFLRWRRRGGHATHGAEFVRRSDYGEYLERALIAACTEAPHARLTVEMGARATDVERTAGGFAVSLADGRELRGDAVVLATGHPAPADPFGGALPASATRYLREPSRHEDLAKIAPGAAVLLIGTGLTAVDVVLALEERGHRGPVHAVSRRGLLPRAHRARRETLPTDLHRALAAGVAVNGLRGIVAALRSVAAAADEHGVGWQAAFDALRPLAPRIWAELCAADRRRFVRLLRPFWDVHRHRLPRPGGPNCRAARARPRRDSRGARARRRGPRRLDRGRRAAARLDGNRCRTLRLGRQLHGRELREVEQPAARAPVARAGPTARRSARPRLCDRRRRRGARCFRPGSGPVRARTRVPGGLLGAHRSSGVARASGEARSRSRGTVRDGGGSGPARRGALGVRGK